MTNSSHNVVQLNVVKEQRVQDSHLYMQYPPAFKIMKEAGEKVLQQLLQELFDNIDDALFELADKAQSNTVQNIYFESMREVRIKRRGMELGFIGAVNTAYRQQFAGDLKEQAAPVAISGDELALVQNEELDELVAVDAMVSKATRSYGDPLKQLTARLASLVQPHHSLTGESNPLGPAVLCRAFVDVCRDLDIDIKAKLVVFKLFDRYVLQSLHGLYKQANHVLASAGITALEQAAEVKQASCGVEPEERSVKAKEDVFSELQSMLRASPAPGIDSEAVGLVAPGVAPQIPRDSLMRLLNNLQVSTVSLSDISAESQPQRLNVQQELSGLLSKHMPDKALSLGQVDDDAINLVAMLFQFILDDRNLAVPMKALIARLQIPIIKVSMIDKSFFSKGGHPARKLLNEIAAAGLGWLPAKSLDRDPLFNKLQSIVETLLNDFDDNPEIFQTVLHDFLAFQEREKRRAALVERRTLDAEDGRARSEVARQCVQNELDSRVSGKALPNVVAKLLKDAWCNVLFLIYLREGDETQAWSDALQTLDDLVWSVQPITEPADRQKLLKLLPDLLKRLRVGLSKIAYDPFAMNELFDELEQVHVTQLQVNTQPEPAPEPSLDALLNQREESLDELDALLDQQLGGLEGTVDAFDTPLASDDAINTTTGSLTLSSESAEPIRPAPEAPVSISDQAPVTAASYEKADSLSMGNWVELMVDGSLTRCRLAAVIKATGKYIFVNRTGMKVAEHNRDSLAQAIDQNQLQLLDDGLLFDRALESVIGNLRDMKGQAG